MAWGIGPCFRATSLGAWQGPIESAYGLHLVLIREEIPSQLQTPEETRTKVLAALLETTRQNATMASFSFTTTWFASMMHLTMADGIAA